MKKIAPLLFLFAALAFTPACGGPPADPDNILPPTVDGYQMSPVVDAPASRESALTPGTFCTSSPSGPPCGGYGTPIGSITCTPPLVGHGVTKPVYFSYGQYHSIYGVWTDHTITSFGAFWGASLLNLQCGTGATFDITMQQIPGLLYNVGSAACHLTRFDGSGNLLSSDAVTIDTGNIQYSPATGADPNGRWSLWLTAPNDPANGVCGNVAFSWAT